MQSLFQNRKVLVTGHTGFKGSWLSLWLQSLGAEVIGYSLDPPTYPNHFTVANVQKGMIDIRGDIRDYASFKKAIDIHQPSVIFHLAAQPIVLDSFDKPKETFDINVGGTVNILEAIRKSESVEAAVIITTDKCYKNQGWHWGYRENDLLGGSDPYSASKSMTEELVSSYRQSFFTPEKLSIPVATVRAGNVIGGGDFSEHRIVPDSMKALMRNEAICVRNPSSVRPWMHVLDALNGYLVLAAQLLTCGHPFAEAWNFGPLEQQGIQVKMLVEKILEYWGSGSWVQGHSSPQKEEMLLLRINWEKAQRLLNWQPLYGWEENAKSIVDWFQMFAKHGLQESSDQMREYSLSEIHRYRQQLCPKILTGKQSASYDLVL